MGGKGSVARWPQANGRSATEAPHRKQSLAQRVSHTREASVQIQTWLRSVHSLCNHQLPLLIAIRHDAPTIFGAQKEVAALALTNRTRALFSGLNRTIWVLQVRFAASRFPRMVDRRDCTTVGTRSGIVRRGVRTRLDECPGPFDAPVNGAAGHVVACPAAA
jgi:hypothetical protein